MDNGVLTTINENGVFTDVNWLPELEISDDDVVDFPELIDIPDHFFDYCFSIDLVATRDDMCYVDGCMIATEIDKFEAFTVSLMQEIISQEENDMLIFMDQFDEDVTNHVEEEENRPSMNFADLVENDESYDLWDRLILSFGDEQKESEDEPLSLAERLRKKLSNMTKIRKGLTVDSGAADHVMPAG